MRDGKDNREKKRPREILGAKSTRNEGLPPKPKSLNDVLFSQCKNKWSSFEIQYYCTSYVNLTRFLKIKFGPEAIFEAFELRLISRAVMCSCNSASRLWKELNLSIGFFFGKVFCL